MQWYKFTLAGPVNAPSSFLDMRTTSNLTPPVDVDTMIGLYSSTGARLLTDDQDGPGSFSAFSFGAICATRPNMDPPLTAGLAGNGRDGATLAAGTYYLAVSGFPTTFGTTGWSVISSHTQTGSVTTELNLGAAQPSATQIIAGAATPGTVIASQNVVLTATLDTSCPNAQTGVSVTIDLTNVGGDAAALMYDDGTNGDATANDHIWTTTYTVPVGIAPGEYSTTATSNNSNGLTASRTINFTTQLGPSVLVPVGGVYTEIEDNETKARANVINAMAAGEAITGTTTGISTTLPGIASADTFRIATATAPLGIYRHQLAITSTTPGHTGSIRGLTQSSGVISTTVDAVLQSSTTTTTPARMNQWYGFGKGEMVYYRITGTSLTTDPYTVTLSDTPITPVNIGSFAVGQITISTFNQGYSADTDMWVYDHTFTAIPGCGNDDETTGTGGSGLTNQSILRRTYAAGTYYLALSDWNVANNLASPPDDRFRDGNVLDFANAILQSNANDEPNLAFSVTDVGGPHPFPASKPGAFGIYWATFTVGTVTNPCGSADFNCDGDSGTDQDIEAFFACIAGNCPPAPLHFHCRLQRRRRPGDRCRHRGLLPCAGGRLLLSRE